MRTPGERHRIGRSAGRRRSPGRSPRERNRPPHLRHPTRRRDLHQGHRVPYGITLDTLPPAPGQRRACHYKQRPAAVVTQGFHRHHRENRWCERISR